MVDTMAGGCSFTSELRRRRSGSGTFVPEALAAFFAPEALAASFASEVSDALFELLEDRPIVKIVVRKGADEEVMCAEMKDESKSVVVV